MSRSGPEHELVRIPTLRALLEAGWSRDQIVCPSDDSGDSEWRVPRTPHDATLRELGRSFASWPVDLAIFDDGAHAGDWEHVFGIFEFKQPDVPAGRSQLETYLGLEPRASFGYWTNGRDSVALYRLADGTLEAEEHAALPRPTDNLRRAAKRPLTYRDLRPTNARQMSALFERLLDTIVANDSMATRPDQRLNEVANLLIVKLESDKVGCAHKDDELGFQQRSTSAETARYVDELYADYKASRPELFLPDDADSIRLNDDTIHWAVSEMQYANFKESSHVAFSKAFQVFRTANLKIGDGQYFTPQRVISAGVRMLDVDDRDRVIDPACGTAGFLYACYRSVSDVYDGELGMQPEARTWAHDRLFGVDRDAINVKLSRALMVAIGDGSTHVFVGDSIRSNRWPSEYPLLGMEAMKPGSYTVVTLNPPFGKNLRISARDARLAGYTVCRHRPGGEPSDEYASTELGIAFVEQSWRLLQPGGRLGVVLPETYFFSKSYAWFRDWLDAHFVLRGVLNIPMEAFQEFCRAKTNFYVLQKRGKVPKTMHVPSWFRDGMCWVSYAPTIGINKDGQDLHVVDDRGERGAEVDDRAGADVAALLDGRRTDTSLFVPLGQSPYVGVPKYSDRTREREFLAYAASALPDFSTVTIGELVDEGLVRVRAGHGSPSADLRNGTVPYIKVSDLRAGLVNVNATNMVPEDVARRMWRGERSGLEDWSVLTPSRASSNIGEVVVLLPGQTQVVLTKEVLVFSAAEAAPFDNFYLAWALDLPEVREEWRRVTFMQTNRDDVGDRYREVLVPVPPSAERATEASAAYRSYYRGLARLRGRFERARRRG